MLKFNFFQFIQEIFVKYFVVIVLSFSLSLLNTYVKRNEETSSLEKFIEFFVKWFLGCVFGIIVTKIANETNYTVVIMITAAVTLGGEIIATFIINNLKDVLEAFKRMIIRLIDKKQ